MQNLRRFKKIIIHNFKNMKSKVNIRKIGNGYVIEITDGAINPVYAITEDELRQIVLNGKFLINNLDEKTKIYE